MVVLIGVFDELMYSAATSIEGADERQTESHACVRRSIGSAVILRWLLVACDGRNLLHLACLAASHVLLPPLSDEEVYLI